MSLPLLKNIYLKQAFIGLSSKGCQALKSWASKMKKINNGGDVLMIHKLK